MCRSVVLLGASWSLGRRSSTTGRFQPPSLGSFANETVVRFVAWAESRLGARDPGDALGTVAGAIGQAVSGWPSEMSRGVDQGNAHGGAVAAHLPCDRPVNCSLFAMGRLAIL